jgi:hypothetical protein
MTRILTIIALLAATSVASAQSTITTSKSFYDKNGSFAGTAQQRGNSSSYYDGQGRFNGSSVQHGNQTSYYDKNGSYSGSTINTGPRR